uniref:Uncharacterized protein n=1 Tax=Anguilla anguilla TaxID=7936 RepID=A0A0E9QXJ3_ANGAN
MYDFQNMSQLSIHYLYLLILVRVTRGSWRRSQRALGERQLL